MHLTCKTSLISDYLNQYYMKGKNLANTCLKKVYDQCKLMISSLFYNLTQKLVMMCDIYWFFSCLLYCT